jgi:hypothetical protein
MQPTIDRIQACLRNVLAYVALLEIIVARIPPDDRGVAERIGRSKEAVDYPRRARVHEASQACKAGAVECRISAIIVHSWIV